MKYLSLFLSASLALGFAGPVQAKSKGVNSTAANGYVAGTPLPVDYWALRNTISTVEISPDGKHILVLKVESKEGNHVLEIYETSDMSKPKRRLNAEPMEIISARWISDTQIFGTAWQVVRKRVSGPEADVRSYASYGYNLDTNKFSRSAGQSNIVSVLPKEPDTVLIASGRAVSGANGVDPFRAFRPASYYRFNLKTGKKSLVLKGTQKYANIGFDIDGNPRYALGQDGDFVVQYYRKPGDTSWTEFDRINQEDKDNLYRFLSGIHGFAGMKQGDPSIGYMIDNRDGSDKAALWEFDFNTGKYVKKLFENKDADVLRIQTSSNFWAGDNKLVAAVYSGEKRERHWFDQSEKSLLDKISKNIKNAHSTTIASRSRDGSSMIVFNSGPKDPGSYYYLNGNKMVKLGSRNHLVKASDLSNVEYIRYTARDGKTIPAYVTKPKGAGPFPLIVLPHGGPHVNEVVGYDEWGQLLANNGYMVLQPQYRMSVGWGKEHFDSAYGQHGLAMQDDKDDGAKHLINKGLVDPDRVAMFGWSYGGYAALVAASRSPNIYQCVIAGAAVADAEKVYRKRKSAFAPKAFDEWAKRRGTIGINPINEIERVNVPVMMVHGDVDARVLVFNMEDYKKEMERVVKEKQIGRCSGGVDDGECVTTLYKNSKGSADGIVPKQVSFTSPGGNQSTYTAKNKFVTLKGADHFSTTLMYNHQKKFYTEMLDYLKNDCGPGGL